MERRKFVRSFKVEAVKLIQERGVAVAPRWVQESVPDAVQPLPNLRQFK